MIHLRWIEMPITVEGVTIPDPDGDFNVYINTLLSESKRKKVVEHELAHIKFDHFYDDQPVIINELEAG